MDNDTYDWDTLGPLYAPRPREPFAGNGTGAAASTDWARSSGVKVAMAGYDSPSAAVGVGTDGAVERTESDTERVCVWK